MTWWSHNHVPGRNQPISAVLILVLPWGETRKFFVPLYPDE